MDQSSMVGGENGNGETIVVRPLAHFDRDVWSDYFSDCNSVDEVAHNQKVQEVNQLKEEVQKELLSDISDPKQRLLFIDAVQRLGVAYCFEEEVEANLQQLGKNYGGDCYKDDLLYVSLRFRLLRQHGFRISCDVFDTFKDEKGCFKECLKNDVQGLLNLYEASDLRLRGEDALDEAINFTKTHLTSLASTLSSPMVDHITHALERPIYRRTTRLETKYQISIYESIASHHQGLLKLAKLDFNLVQQLHRQEVAEQIRWWKDLDFTEKYPYSRDRVVEGFCWTLGFCYEPKFSRCRRYLGKLLKMATVIDDTYDAYGTMEELEPFTEAILRWDDCCTNQLPEYMRFMYQKLLDIFREFEEDLAKEGRTYAVDMHRKEVQATIQAYIKEAKWCHAKYIPPYEEYIKVALQSCTYTIMLMSVYQGIDEIASEDAIKWMIQNSKAMKSSCILSRIMNDMGGHKVEHKRNHVASAVECYMANYSVSEEEAYEELERQVEELWKDIREEMLRPTAVPMPLLVLNLNVAKSMYEIYHIGGDGYTKSEYMKAYIEALLIEPAI